VPRLVSDPDQFRSLRRRNGLSVLDISRITRIPCVVLRDFEHGQRRLHPHNVLTLEAAAVYPNRNARLFDLWMPVVRLDGILGRLPQILAPIPTVGQRLRLVRHAINMPIQDLAYHSGT
jgi:hypothetical protein